MRAFAERRRLSSRGGRNPAATSDRRGTQTRERDVAMNRGSGRVVFEPVENWEKLPPGWSLIDVAGVAVNARDNVYVFNRGEHPVAVFDRDGNLLRSFGEGQFSQRLTESIPGRTIRSIASTTGST